MKKTEPQIYIKPTRHVHESGFRTFEVGYIDEMTEDNRVAKKRVLGVFSDHIYMDYLQVKDTPYSLNMDLTMDGYIRLFSHSGQLIWDDDVAYSSMGIKLIPKEKTA